MRTNFWRGKWGIQLIIKNASFRARKRQVEKNSNFAKNIL
jgi:hypothetical protein